MTYYCIIVAGGSGKRMRSDVPKQFLLIGGKPVLMHTINRFVNSSFRFQIILGLPSGQIEYWKKLCLDYHFNIEHKIVIGGETRFQTVKNCLKNVQSDGIVLIHDGVRPLVSSRTISNCIETATLKGTAIPVISCKESIRKFDSKETYAVKREHYCLIHTPQAFKSSFLLKSYEMDYKPEFTDDASVVESAGYKINLIEDDDYNIKITTPDDIFFAEYYLSKYFSTSQ